MDSRRKSSRKHLLGQQTSKKTSVVRRVSVRVPPALSSLIINAVADAGVSRNKWVSEALEKFRSKYVLDRLELPPIDSEDTAKMSQAELDKYHGQTVNRGLVTLVKETFIVNTGGVGMQILLNDEGLYAMQDILSRIESVLDATESTHGMRTTLLHIALWDRIMENKNIPDVAKLVATHKKTKPRAKSRARAR